MGYAIKVSTDDVATKAATVARQVSELESQLGVLSGDMASLAGTWTGTASTAFQALYHGWNKQASAMQTALNDIGLSLRGAGVAYDDTEAGIASRLG